MDNSVIDVWAISIGLLGGLALFLFGLDQLTDMLKTTAGPRMADLLARATTNRFKALLTGAFTTGVIQSSSVTTVLVVGFVSAGLMSLPQSIGIIMGAEIGTTVTAQIIAFKVTNYALIAVVIGFTMQFFFEDEQVKRYGKMVLGLGLVFYGMNLMSNATYPLRSYQPFIDLLAQMDNPLLAIAISAGFTALIQSSSAATGVIIVLGSQGLISLEQGIALVFGANIGTCVTALLASIGKQRLGLRAAMVHVTFNCAGVLIWFGFIDELAQMARWLSPTASELTGSARLAEELPRQIANAHTIFNVTNAMVFIWFTGLFAWLVLKLVPDKPESGSRVIEPKFLNEALIEAPALALDAARMEIVRMGRHVQAMVQQSVPAVLRGSRRDLERLREMDNEIDILHRAIVHYLGRISREELSNAETEAQHDYLSAATLYESIGDIVETDLVHVGEERLRRNVQVSSETQDMMTSLLDKVVWSIEAGITAVDLSDRSHARKVVEAKETVNDLAGQITDRLVQRLVAEDPHRTSTYRVESQLVEHLKRIYYFSKRVAKLVAEVDVATSERAEPTEAA